LLLLNNYQPDRQKAVTSKENKYFLIKMTMKKYIIQDSETGTFIDQFNTYQEALTELQKYENEDKQDGIFTPDFYEIVEK